MLACLRRKRGRPRHLLGYFLRQLTLLRLEGNIAGRLRLDRRTDVALGVCNLVCAGCGLRASEPNLGPILRQLAVERRHITNLVALRSLLKRLRHLQGELLCLRVLSVCLLHALPRPWVEASRCHAYLILLHAVGSSDTSVQLEPRVLAIPRFSIGFLAAI